MMSNAHHLLEHRPSERKLIKDKVVILKFQTPMTHSANAVQINCRLCNQRCIRFTEPGRSIKYSEDRTLHTTLCHRPSWLSTCTCCQSEVWNWVSARRAARRTQPLGHCSGLAGIAGVTKCRRPETLGLSSLTMLPDGCISAG